MRIKSKIQPISDKTQREWAKSLLLAFIHSDESLKENDCFVECRLLVGRPFIRVADFLEIPEELVCKVRVFRKNRRKQNAKYRK